MYQDPNQLLKKLGGESNRLVFTRRAPFDVKNRKKVAALFEEKKEEERKLFCRLLTMEFDPNQDSTSWMSPADTYINFLFDREYIGNLGIVDSAWLRSEELPGDCYMKQWPEVEEWLFTRNVIAVKSQ